MPKQPFVPVEKCIRIKIQGVHQTQPWVNLYSVQYTGSTPDNPQMSTFCTAVGAAWNTALAPYYTTSTQQLNVTAWDLTNANAATGVDTVVHTGTVAATTLLPNSVAYAVSWPIQSRWRGGHFRTYSVPRNTTDVTGGRTLTTAAHDTTLNAFAAFRTALNSILLGGAAVTMVGIRYFPTGVGVVRTSGQPYVFSAPVVHNRIDSQRRRTGKEIS